MLSGLPGLAEICRNQLFAGLFNPRRAQFFANAILDGLLKNPTVSPLNLGSRLQQTGILLSISTAAL
jgi:hypothetical protein